jgi:hypothetical protein
MVAFLLVGGRRAFSEIGRAKVGRALIRLKGLRSSDDPI